MSVRRLFAGLSLSVLCLLVAPPVQGLANRVFVSARSGNNANSCDDISTPCQTFAGAVLQVNTDGEVIVLDSGGYGPVTITKGMTIEAPAGITAFIHPPAGDAITINAGVGKVTIRGLVLGVGAVNGITVNSVGTLNVENCFITGFASNGILMISSGYLNLKGTDITACGVGARISNTLEIVQASIDHCHLDGNLSGFFLGTVSPGAATAMASYSTANNNSISGGWEAGGTGKEVLNLEFCVGSGNNGDGLFTNSSHAMSSVRYSNCVFANNEFFGVRRQNLGTAESRGNNTLTGNSVPTSGMIGSFSPM